jgi:hypothetical protein
MIASTGERSGTGLLAMDGGVKAVQVIVSPGPMRPATDSIEAACVDERTGV